MKKATGTEPVSIFFQRRIAVAACHRVLNPAFLINHTITQFFLPGKSFGMSGVHSRFGAVVLFRELRVAYIDRSCPKLRMHPNVRANASKLLLSLRSSTLTSKLAANGSER